VGITHRAQALLRRAARATATAAGSDVTVTVDGIRYVVDRSDGGPGGALFEWRVLPEFGALQRAVELLTAHGDSPVDSLLVDVGANIGTTCLTAVVRHDFNRALAIEPYSMNARLLRANADLNGLADRVTVVEAAASDVEGETTFAAGKATTRGRHRSGAGTLRTDGVGSDVRVVTVDAELRRRGISADDVGLLWADVQGHEARVALGAIGVVQQSRPFVFAARTGKLERKGDLETLATLVETHYAHVIDLRDPTSRIEAASSVRALLKPRATTDILAFGSPTQGASG
jgi:FkbM family methyltransferase